MPHDLIKKKVIFTRSTSASYFAVPVEFPVGLNQVVSLIAVHWSIEFTRLAAGQGLFWAALSENPNHLATPPAGVAEFQGDPDMYGMACFIGNMAGAHFNPTVLQPHVIPLYGILRPKRQVAVFANVWGTNLGCRCEIYYEEEEPAGAIVDAISRRSGKSRRS